MPRLARQPQQPIEPPKEPTPAQLAAMAAGAERLKAASEARRKVTPVRSRRHDIDVVQETVRQEPTRGMRSTGPAKEALDPPEIIRVNRPPSGDKLKRLAYMEEELTIIVHDTTDPTADPIPEVINGGDRNRQYFIRGQEQKVKRKYVEILARAKVTSRGNEKFQNALGDDDYRYPAHTAPRYPFTVIHDPHPMDPITGQDWLKTIRSEP